MTTTPAPQSPQRIGAYRITGFLGRGGMGMVLRAEGADGRAVAIKTLLNEQASDHARKRFAREGEMLATLDHPGIVSLLDSGRAEETDWIALELIEGGDLEERLAQGLPDSQRTRQIAREVALALAHAHERGVFHRDIKPANLLLEAGSSRVVVTDFGVGRDLERSRMTKTGAMVGTITCMAPEQLKGAANVGPPVDVWALGALIYRCLTNESPAPSGSLPQIAEWLKSRRVTSPLELRPDADPQLVEVCLRCLAWDPEERPSAGEVAELLVPRRTSRAPARLRLGFAGVLVLGLGLGLGFGLAQRGPAPLPTPNPSATPSPSSERSVWSLAREGPASVTIEEPLLWRVPGRSAAPLIGASSGHAEALRAAFWGEAESLGGGRVQVRYADLERAAHVSPKDVGTLVASYAGPVGVLPGGVIKAPDNISLIHLRIGEARWRAPQLSFEIRARPGPGVDLASLKIRLGGTPTDLGLDLHGRQRRRSVRVAGKSTYEPYVLPADWTRIHLAPGARAGERAVFEGAVWKQADDLLAEPASPGHLEMVIGEHEFGVRRLVISGVPLRADRGALAWIPGSSREPLELRATYRGPAPTLTFATNQESFTLELNGDQLQLWRGRDLLRSHTVQPRPDATISLEHQAGHLRGSLETLAGLAHVEAWEWRLAQGQSLRAAYGSRGPETHFESVELRARTSTAEPGLGARAWAEGAKLLERVAVLSARDPELSGARATQERRRVAKLAAETLAKAAEELTSPGARTDARAREVWAWVVGGKVQPASTAMQTLLHESGEAAAREALSWCSVFGDEAHLLISFSEGYSFSEDAVREAATRAYLQLRPERGEEYARASALTLLGELLAGRGEVAESLVLLAEAGTLSSARSLTARRARVLLNAKRNREAVELLESISRLQRNGYVWRSLLQGRIALGQADQAIEAACGLVARQPSPQTRRALESLLASAARASSRTHLATACLVLAHAARDDPATRKLWRDRAATEARQVGATQSLRERDLVRYVLLCATDLQSEIMSKDDGSRPTSVLTRALAGDEQARAKLREASNQDTLVFALTAVNPELLSYLGRR